jgi:hypothetical protein
MTYWIEVHCDIRTEGMVPHRPCGELVHRCRSNRGDNPGVMVRPDQSVVVLAANTARQAGWVRTNGRWVCPGCRTDNQPRQVNR